MKCDSCGVESPLDAAFRPIVRVFQKPWRYCPACASRRDRLLTKCSALIVFPFFVILSVLGVAVGAPKDRQLLLFPLALLVFFWLGVVPHELAHAVAGRLLGLRVFRLRIGVWGPTLWRWTIFGTEICVTPLPSGGVTFVGAPSLRFVRSRWALMVAAGPLANALLAVAALFLRPGESWGESLVVPFAIANLMLVAVSLFPWRHATPYGKVESDGLVLLSSPFASHETLAKRHIFYFAQEGVEQIQAKNFRAAIDWAERGLREYPTNLSLRSVLGSARLGLEEFSEARETFQECLQACGEDLGQRALFLNNVAWTDLFMDEPLPLDEADRYSEEALRIAPWHSWIQGTRGMVLVELGDLDEGINLLKKSLASNNDAQSKAINACCLAIAFARKHDADESRKYLQQARKFDAECSLIRRAEMESAGREFECDRFGPVEQAVPADE